MGRELVTLVDGSGLTLLLESDEPARCGFFSLVADCWCGDDFDGAEL
jgi:hypothetical protein